MGTSATMKSSSILFGLLLNFISQQAWALDPTDSIMHGGEFSPFIKDAFYAYCPSFLQTSRNRITCLIITSIPTVFQVLASYGTSQFLRVQTVLQSSSKLSLWFILPAARGFRLCWRSPCKTRYIPWMPSTALCTPLEICQQVVKCRFWSLIFPDVTISRHLLESRALLSLIRQLTQFIFGQRVMVRLVRQALDGRMALTVSMLWMRSLSKTSPDSQ